jgi:hypothetical protein
MSSRRRTALGGDVDHPTDKRTNPDGMNRRMKKLKNLKHLQKKNLLRKSQAHRSKQVWKEKVTSSPSQEEQSSESLSLRPDDAPEK